MIFHAARILVELLIASCVFYVSVSYSLAFLLGGRTLPAGILRAMLSELVATLVLLPLWPLWWIVGGSYRAALEGEGRARGERHPVVLLHGLAMNRTSWIWLGRRLINRGAGPLYGTTYFSPQSVHRSAIHLQRFVERVRAREDSPRVDIVAHSLGGLIARYYIEHLGGAEQVGRLITIGSPHKGSAMGRFGFGPAVRATLPDSEFLHGLGPFNTSNHVTYTSIWSRSDAVIVPAESSAIAPAGVDYVFDGLGHLALLLSPRVADVVARRLSE